MRLGYFSMPLHPAGRNWSETLREDREAVILADRLGFHDAFIGEHLTDRHENITNSLVFLATLISDTEQIRLGTGTTNLSQQHPVLVAANSAMFDHLADGRFILGISPGALPSDAEALGILDQDRNEMFAEAIDVITAIWESEPPYSLVREGGRFSVTTERTLDLDLGVGILPKPLQQPRPEIVGTVVAPFSKGVVAMGARNFHPLSANFLLPQWVATHWPNYVQGKESVGEQAATDGLARGPHRVRRRRRRGGRVLRPQRRQQPVPLLLHEDADEDAQDRPPRAVQDAPRPTRRRGRPSTASSISWSSPAPQIGRRSDPRIPRRDRRFR